jgi:hypothetical protein
MNKPLKYENCFNEVDPGTFLSQLGKEKQQIIQHYDYQDNFEAPHFISVWIWGKTGVTIGNGILSTFPPSSLYAGTFRAWPHSHPSAETFSFMGTDPDHPDDLGGVMEYWIGEGEDAEEYVITKPTTVLVPRNIVHTPIRAREIRTPIIMFVVMDAPIHTDISVKEGYLPPSFKYPDPSLKGWVPKPMVNKREYQKFITEIDTKTLPVFPSYNGRAARITHYDASINRDAPHYIDCTLVYKEGLSFGIGNSKLPETSHEQEHLVPNEAYSPHRHAALETYSFIGLDQDHIGDLGGTVEFWMGEGEQAEKYTINKPTNILVPRNTVHLPMYIREVHRPFIIATVLDYHLWAGNRLKINNFR